MGPAAVLLLLAAASLAQAATTAAAAGCRSYVSKGLIQPATGTLQDVVVVQDAFVVQDLSLSIDLSHRRIGALKITLGAAPFSNAAAGAAAHPTIIVKSHGLGRRGQDMYHTTFSDGAATSFPVNATFAPFTGTFRPVQKLAFLIDGDLAVAGSGGSQGMWTVTVSDVAPNNSLREMALNGWTLQLCDREQPQQSPSPSPAPASSPSPAPPVVAAGGPAVSTGGSPPSANNPIPTGTAGSNILGWQVVYRNQPPGSAQQPATGAAAPPAAWPAAAGAGPAAPPAAWPAAAGAGPVAQSLQALLAQRPLLTLLQQQIGAIASGAGGVCDATCQQAKQGMWRAAVFGLYMHAVAQKHGVDRQDWAALLQHVRDWLPGDNSRLGELQGWLEAHANETSQLGGWLHDHLRLPTVMVNGAPLQLPAIGHGAGLQQLLSAFSNGGDGIRSLLSAFASAGDRIAGLATHFAGNTADRAQALGQAWAGGKERLAAALQAGGPLRGALAHGATRQTELLSSWAGVLDDHGSAVQEFMASLDGDNLQQLVGNLAGLFDFAHPS